LAQPVVLQMQMDRDVLNVPWNICSRTLGLYNKNCSRKSATVRIVRAVNWNDRRSHWSRRSPQPVLTAASICPKADR